MKRSWIFLLISSLFISLCACGSNTEKSNTEKNEVIEENQTAQKSNPEYDEAIEENQIAPKTNPEYDEVIKEIQTAQGAYDIWEKYKDNTDAINYILSRITAPDVVKLMVEHNTLYGYSIEHTSEMGELIEIMASSGFEKYPKDVILKALDIYLPTTPGFDNESFSALSSLDDKEFYDRVSQLFNGASEANDAESLLLTEAYKRAETKLKNGLKNPSSYKMSSIMGSKVDYDPNTGEYIATIVITYTATNSFGGTVQDKYTYYETGTYIDGRIKYTN